jgi:LAO/AO transport system kinase
MDNSVNKDYILSKNTMLGDADFLIEGIKKKDKVALGRAVTIVESNNTDKQAIAHKIIAACLPLSGSSIRLGITGTPGVGKSTFIEAIGLKFIEKGHKVAVLAIDPSSSVTGGSILGDKTRMQYLSTNTSAFIRPTASSMSLGGVARATRETIILCEAAGFDIIIIETVGVGQSEIAVNNLVDAFILLLQPGAGDELQGIKRGIVEMADIVIVNKADGDKLGLAKEAKQFYKNALHLLSAKDHEQIVNVFSCSALHNIGIDEIQAAIFSFIATIQQNGFFEKNRAEQRLIGFEETIKAGYMDLLLTNTVVKKEMFDLEYQIKSNIITPYQAADSFLELIKSILRK